MESAEVITNKSGEIQSEDVSSQKLSPDASTTTSYLNQWMCYFEDNGSGELMLSKLQSSAFKESLRSCHFRSVCWRVFLRCLPVDVKEWTNAIATSRQEYKHIKQSHVSDPRLENPVTDIQVENPLSQSDKSIWSQFFRNNELRALIERDVRRTCPEMDFYHSTKIHDVMANILFCYAREHESLSYRQGMHELLAPLVFVLHSDLQGAGHARDMGSLPKLVTEVLNEDYLEHDAYAMFSKLMDATNSWYSMTESETLVSDETKDDTPIATVPFQETEVQTRTSLQITNKLNHIHDTLLATIDQELHHHLNRLQIIPQVYGLRWVRLLFGREFVLQDLLVLWDALFADSSSLDLVDYIFIAMMYNIRDRLLTSDYCSCMQLLMKYPPIEDIYDLLHLAMYFRDPKNHRRPSHLKFRQQPQIPGKKSPIKKNKTNSFLSFKIDNPFSNIGRDLKKVLNPDHAKTSTDYPGSPARVRTLSKQGERSDAEGSRSVVQNSEQTGEQYRRDLEAQVSSLKQQVQDLKEKCRFCSDKVDANIRLLQHGVDGRRSRSGSSNELGDCPVNENDDDADQSYAVANLKQVRDILRGTVSMEGTKPISLQTKVDNLPTPPSVSPVKMVEMKVTNENEMQEKTS